MQAAALQEEVGAGDKQEEGHTADDCGRPVSVVLAYATVTSTTQRYAEAVARTLKKAGNLQVGLLGVTPTWLHLSSYEARLSLVSSTAWLLLFVPSTFLFCCVSTHASSNLCQLLTVAADNRRQLPPTEPCRCS